MDSLPLDGLPLPSQSQGMGEGKRSSACRLLRCLSGFRPALFLLPRSLAHRSLALPLGG